MTAVVLLRNNDLAGIFVGATKEGSRNRERLFFERRGVFPGKRVVYCHDIDPLFTCRHPEDQCRVIGILSLKTQHDRMDGLLKPCFGIGWSYPIKATLKAGYNQRISVAGRQRVRPIPVNVEKLSDGYDFGCRPTKKTKRSRIPEN